MFLYGNINMFDYRVFPTLTLHNIVMHHTIRVKYNISECWNIWPCDTLQRVYSIFIWYIRKTEVLFAVCYFARYHKAPGQGADWMRPALSSPKSSPTPSTCGNSEARGAAFSNGLWQPSLTLVLRRIWAILRLWMSLSHKSLPGFGSPSKNFVEPF